MTTQTTDDPYYNLLGEHQDITILHWEQCEFQDDGENYVPDKWITGWMTLPEWNS